jgi:hypothetical protein
MTHHKKQRAIRASVPAPKMLKIVEGRPARPELSWEAFRDAIKVVRAEHPSEVESLAPSTSEIVVALCNQVLICPPDLASTIAVRAAFRLGGFLSQGWSVNTWDEQRFGEDVATGRARRSSAAKANKTGKRPLAKNVAHGQVKQLFTKDPSITAAKAQQHLIDLGMKQSDRPNNKALQGWIRVLREKS